MSLQLGCEVRIICRPPMESCLHLGQFLTLLFTAQASSTISFVCLHSPSAETAILETVQVQSDRIVNPFVVLHSVHAQT